MTETAGARPLSDDGVRRWADYEIATPSAMMSHDFYVQMSRAVLALLARYEAAEAALARVREERDGLLAFKRGIDEALNSGDGVYRP